MALEPGDRVGPYEILAVLGRGGMGTVYRALDQRLQRQVALKFLHGDADPAGTGEWHRRLLQEAQLASALVSGTGSPPPAGICHSVRLPARADEKTTARPSGVQGLR